MKDQQALTYCKSAELGVGSTVWVVAVELGGAAEDTGAMGCSKGSTEGRGEVGGMRKVRCEER